MSLVTLPALFRPRTCQLTASTNQRVSASPFGGIEQAVDLLSDRWLLSCDLSESKQAGAAWREAFVGKLRGQTNLVQLWHFTRPQPRGTLRGSLTLSSTLTQGAAVLPMGGVGANGKTLLAGDMLGVGGLLFMVADDCVGDGADQISVPITTRSRLTIFGGSVVTWLRPTAQFRLLATSGVGYSPGRASSTSFDFGEFI